MDSTPISTRSRIKMLAAIGVGLVGGISAARGVLALDGEATPDAGTSGETNSIVIHALEYGYELPESVPSGWTRITLINHGSEDHHAQLIAIPSGQTFEDLMNLFESEGPAALGMVTMAGGPGSVAPELISEAVIWLDPGTYAVVCFISGRDGVPHLMKGMAAPLAVTDAVAGTQPPIADVPVPMHDFAFSIPTELPEGPTTFELVNDGIEPHEFAVLKLAEGVTPEMFGEFMATMGEDHSPDEPVETGHEHSTPSTPENTPFTPVGGLQAMATGMTGYTVIDLLPATYMAVCFIPSLANDGAPHLMLGMVASFTVA